jgi:hypothetical protein
MLAAVHAVIGARGLGAPAFFDGFVAAASPASGTLLVATSGTDGHLVANARGAKTKWRGWSVIS